MHRKNVYHVCFVKSDSYRDVMTYIVIHNIGTTLKLNHSGYAQWLNISVYEKYGTLCNYYYNYKIKR